MCCFEFAEKNAEYADILAFLPSPTGEPEPDDATNSNGDQSSDGSVYMLKLGKHYKIGKSYDVPRRHREIALELPEKPSVVHSIRTDDPDGIETYWHSRFAQKATNGEWFSLSPADVRAFKRRKFM